MDIQKQEIKKDKKIEDRLVTSTDLIILNTLLYLYNQNNEPVTIPDIARATAINYTTIRYSINKFKTFGVIKEVSLDNKRAKLTGYIPKTRSVLVLEKNYVLIILEDVIIPYLLSYTDMNEHIGNVLELDQAPQEIKEVIEGVKENIEALAEYGFILKEDYLDVLYKQYLDIRKRLYS